jgi:(E)-4-hydroxy-3-methylbut-2-enyl-diphosphate synthase
MKILRRKSRPVKIGSLTIGGGALVSVQSMAKTKTSDVENTLGQLKELEIAGCEIARLAIKDSADTRALREIKRRCRIPLVADIHFHAHLALEAIDNGADKIRLNPGNIYKDKEIKEIVRALKAARIPLRVGVNSGSLGSANSKRDSLPGRLTQSALSYIRKIERLHFYDLVVSLKAPDALATVEAYRRIAKLCNYPLHLGVTATGLALAGAIKSSIALGALLLEGIGDTIRVSLTDTPGQEVAAARVILESLGLRSFGPQIISCPTCGRCSVDIVKIVKELEDRLSTVNSSLSARPMKVAVMGCTVNGPGEAKCADIGVAFGKREGLLFSRGKIIRKVTSLNCIGALLKEMEKAYV